MSYLSDIPNIRECLNTLRHRLKPANTVPLPRKGAERRAAAVLVPLFDRNGSLHVLYTRRSDRLANHRGQVAFPGGRFDHRDRNLLDAALREAHEEVGIEPNTVEVLGTFDGRRTNSTDIMVAPFVGIIPDLRVWRPDPHEVAEIFEVPLAALSDRRYRGVYRWRRNGMTSEHAAILYGGQTIWGLTYELTLKFLALLGGPAA